MAHRILIVEDTPVDQRLFERALSEPGREIEVCSDGREALAAFERRAADLVVSDIVMPNMEGLELLSELHTRVPGLPVILVTRFGNIPPRWLRCATARLTTSPSRWRSSSCRRA